VWLVLEMELVEAAKTQHWERFKVRRPRPLLTPSVVRREPSVLRSVSGPSKPSVARRIRPCCAASSALRQAPLRQFRFRMQALLRAGEDAKFRGSYAPLPYCRISPFLAASFARNRRFRDFLKFGTFGGCASGERDGEYSLPLTFSQNENAVDPRGLLAVLFLGTGWDWGYPVGSTPLTPAPPCTAMASPRCTGRRSTAIAESSDCSSHPKPT
jgi:hypothetical protein